MAMKLMLRYLLGFTLSLGSTIALALTDEESTARELARERQAQMVAGEVGALRFRDRLLAGGKAPAMLSIPAATFLMGRSDADVDPDEAATLELPPDELPAHTVSLSAFAASQFPVTLHEWQACQTADGCEAPLPDATRVVSDTPVTGVSWDQAQAYVRWLSAQTGRSYRLPSEAEYEYLLRADSGGVFPWGDEANAGCEYAHNTTDCDDASGFTLTAPVGLRKANDFGLYDTVGNVLQWVQDCYQPSYIKAPANGKPVELSACPKRALRGASFMMTLNDLRIARRDSMEADVRSLLVGFRVAAGLTESEIREAEAMRAAAQSKNPVIPVVPDQFDAWFPVSGTPVALALKRPQRFPASVLAGLHAQGRHDARGIPIGTAWLLHRQRDGEDLLLLLDEHGRSIWPASVESGNDYLEDWTILSTAVDLTGDGLPDGLIQSWDGGNGNFAMSHYLIDAANPLKPLVLSQSSGVVPVTRVDAGLPVFWARESMEFLVHSGYFEYGVTWPLRAGAGVLTTDFAQLAKSAIKEAPSEAEVSAALVEGSGDEALLQRLVSLLLSRQGNGAREYLDQVWPPHRKGQQALLCALVAGIGDLSHADELQAKYGATAQRIRAPRSCGAGS